MKTTLVRLIVPVVALSILSGCSGENKPAAGPVGSAAAHGTGEHKHAGHGAGPHEGTLADWGGGKFHVEFTVDHPKQETMVYVLGDDERTAAPIKAKDGKLLLSIQQPVFQVELKADPQAGEAAGTSSRFVGKDAKLGVVQEFAGSISGEVDGTPYVGEFKEEPHGAHEHK